MYLQVFGISGSSCWINAARQHATVRAAGAAAFCGRFVLIRVGPFGRYYEVYLQAIGITSSCYWIMVYPKVLSAASRACVMLLVAGVATERLGPRRRVA